jgi:hypothetical protein
VIFPYARHNSATSVSRRCTVVNPPQNHDVERDRDCREHQEHHDGNPQVLIKPRNAERRGSNPHDHNLYTQAGKNRSLRNVLPAESCEVALLRRINRQQISGSKVQGSGEKHSGESRD